MPKPQYPSEKLDQYMLRFPDGMRERIKQAAAENGRSMNAEIIYRLQTTLEMDAYVPIKANAHTDDSVERLTSLLNEATSIVSRYKKVLGEE